MKSDEELKKYFKIFVDKNEIINLVVLVIEKESECNVRMIEIVSETLEEIFRENPQKIYNLLVDISPVGNIGSYAFPSKARKTAVQIASHKQVRKAAFIATSLFVKTVIGFIITAAGKGKNIKGFSDKEEAMSWLKGGEKQN